MILDPLEIVMFFIGPLLMILGLRIIKDAKKDLKRLNYYLKFKVICPSNFNRKDIIKKQKNYFSLEPLNL